MIFTIIYKTRGDANAHNPIDMILVDHTDQHAGLFGARRAERADAARGGGFPNGDGRLVGHRLVGAGGQPTAGGQRVQLDEITGEASTRSGENIANFACVGDPGVVVAKGFNQAFARALDQPHPVRLFGDQAIDPPDAVQHRIQVTDALLDRDALRNILNRHQQCIIAIEDHAVERATRLVGRPVLTAHCHLNVPDAALRDELPHDDRAQRRVYVHLPYIDVFQLLKRVARNTEQGGVGDERLPGECTHPDANGGVLEEQTEAVFGFV